MADIIGLDGQRMGSSQPKPSTKEHNPHTYSVAFKDGATMQVYGKLFLTPLFVAFENPESGEFDAVVSFEQFSTIVNLDTIEASTDGAN